MTIDLFLILLLPMCFYGYKQSIWTNSRTTLIVIIAAFIIIFSAKFYDLNTVLLETYLFLMFLFVRAIFREKFKNVKNSILKGIIYA
jgi:hypothetical protein